MRWGFSYRPATKPPDKVVLLLLLEPKGKKGDPLLGILFVPLIILV